MDAALSRRLAALFTAAGADTDERDLLIAAAEKAATFDDLPEPAKQLVGRLEARARKIAAQPDPPVVLADRMDGGYQPPILAEPNDRQQPEAREAATDEAGVNQLKQYWLHGGGLKKWATSPHPWTALYHELRKHLSDDRAKRIASQWYHDHFGRWPGQHDS